MGFCVLRTIGLPEFLLGTLRLKGGARRLRVEVWGGLGGFTPEGLGSE